MIVVQRGGRGGGGGGGVGLPEPLLAVPTPWTPRAGSCGERCKGGGGGLYSLPGTLGPLRKPPEVNNAPIRRRRSPVTVIEAR